MNYGWICKENGRIFSKAFQDTDKEKKTQTNNKDFNTHIEVKEQGQT